MLCVAFRGACSASLLQTVSVCVCVCERESVCVSVCERERECVCVCAGLCGL